MNELLWEARIFSKKRKRSEEKRKRYKKFVLQGFSALSAELLTLFIGCPAIRAKTCLVLHGWLDSTSSNVRAYFFRERNDMKAVDNHENRKDKGDCRANYHETVEYEHLVSEVVAYFYNILYDARHSPN